MFALMACQSCCTYDIPYSYSVWLGMMNGPYILSVQSWRGTLAKYINKGETGCNFTIFDIMIPSTINH